MATRGLISSLQVMASFWTLSNRIKMADIALQTANRNCSMTLKTLFAHHSLSLWYISGNKHGKKELR